MSNVRRGALALAIAAIMWAVPEVASAQQPIVTKFSLPIGVQVNPCVGITGELVMLNGLVDFVTYVKPGQTAGQFHTMFRANGQGTGQSTSGASYHYQLSQTANTNMAAGTDTVLIMRIMLVRQGETATPDDLIVRIFFHIVLDANNNIKVALGSFEPENTCQ